MLDTYTVKLRSHHYIAHQHPQQMSLPSINFLTSRFLRYGLVKIFKLKVIMTRSNYGYSMTSHTYIPQPKSLSSINFLHLTVSEIQPGQTFCCDFFVYICTRRDDEHRIQQRYFMYKRHVKGLCATYQFRIYL